MPDGTRRLSSPEARSLLKCLLKMGPDEFTRDPCLRILEITSFMYDAQIVATPLAENTLALGPIYDAKKS